jgi:hypothetical protein
VASLYNFAKAYLVSQAQARQWLRVWLPFILLGSLPGFFAGRWFESLLFAVLGSCFLLLSFISVKKSFLFSLSIIVLAALVVLALLGQWRAGYVWLNSERHQTLSYLSSWREDTVTARSSRTWQIPSDVSSLELTLEAKLLSGTLGWQWIPSVKGYSLGPATENGVTFTRVTTPAEGDPFLLRNFMLPTSIGVQTFKAEVTLRSNTPFAAEGCRGIWLQTWLEGGGASCSPVALTSEWQTFEHTWTAPPEAVSRIIRLILNDFDALSYDVGTTKLFRQTETTWEELRPLQPTTPGLASSWDVWEGDGGYSFDITPEWQPYTFTFHKPSSASTNELSATLLLPEAVTLATRNVTLSVPSSPVVSGLRQSYVFGHPNLAGHTVVVLMLIALALASKVRWQIVAGVLGVAACYFTGSRTAWIVLLLGVVGLLWLRHPSRRKQLTILYAVFFLALAVAWPFLGRFQITSVSNVVSRQEIWQTSLEIARDHLGLGIGFSPQTFSALWTTYNPDAAEVITHAHNIVLEALVDGGVIGVVALLWLLGGLFWIAWLRKQWFGVVLVVMVVLLNMADVSLFYTWVLLPLLFYLNARE